jgi:uroporphyrinogen decarboxylase
MEMNSRERLRTAINHQEPDRIPLDIGATVVTGIHWQAYKNLREYLQLSDEKEIKIMDVVQQLAVVEEDVRSFLKVDVSNVTPRSSPKSMIEIQEEDKYTYFYDEWGIGWQKPKISGIYYDMFVHPLKDVHTIEEVKDFPWPDPLDPVRFDGLKERVQYAAEEEGQAVVLGGLCAGIMEIAAWTLGFERYFSDFALNPALLGCLLDKILELKIAYWEKALQEAGEYVDVVQEADDFAGQYRMLISPEMYREIIKPRHKELFDFIHSSSDAKIFFHSCGAIRPVIPDLIEAGVDILNPVQVSAAGMDSAELKREYGKDLTFWGGGVDTQNILGNGTPEEVCEEVKKRIEDLAPGGGFVFSAVHNIQPNVPPQNIMAMWKTFQENCSY